MKFDHSYLAMAEVWAQNSYCKRRKVGALLVKDRTIISDGYNGTPSGFENICEDENGVTKPYVLHAEANAITKVAKALPCMSRLRPVRSVPNSSSRPVSAGLFTGTPTGSRTE